MNKDIEAIFENYQGTWDLSPQESFKKDKEFFQYVIESNPHLAPLRNVKLKYIFELYKLKLKENLNRDMPGLITESKQLNLTFRESFDIIQEFTKNVSDKSAYEGVKEIFESICVDYLLQKGEGLLQEAVYRDTSSAVRRGTRQGMQDAARGQQAPGGRPSRSQEEAAARGGRKAPSDRPDLVKRRARYAQKRDEAAAQPQPGATETITKDVEAVARPAAPAGPTAQAIQQQQELRTQGAELKKLQAQQGQPTAAEIQGQQKQREMQAQNDAMQKQIEDMEAKEAQMTATQKAASDKQQEAMQQQMAAMAAVMQQMAGQQQQQAQGAAQQAQGAEQQAQGAQQRAQGAAQQAQGAQQAASQDRGLADRMRAAARGKPPVIGKEGGSPPQGTFGVDDASSRRLGGTLEGPTTDSSRRQGSYGVTGPTTSASSAAPKKPGMLSRAGGWLKDKAKKALPVAGMIGGAALGSALGPAGTIGGAALGKALGAGAQSAANAPKGFGSRLGAAMKTPVGKHLGQGAAVGALGSVLGAGGGGEEVVDTDTSVEYDPIRQSPDIGDDIPGYPNTGGEPNALLNPAQGNYQPLGAGGEGTSYADTADVNSPEYQATMSQYADTQPALMQRSGEMGPGMEPSMGDQAPAGWPPANDVSGTIPPVEGEVTSTDVEDVEDVDETRYSPGNRQTKGGGRLMNLAARR